MGNMSKEEIEKYIRDNLSKFSISDLMQKLVDGGYSKEDVDEVGSKITGGKKTIPVISKKGGFRWLWWTGMFMFIFLGMWIFNFAVSFLAGSIPSMVGIITLIVLLIVSLIGFVIVLEGWLRLAKYTNSKLMRFGVLGILYTVIVTFVILVIGIIVSLVAPQLIVMLGLLSFVILGVYFLAILFLFVCAVLIYVALIKIRRQVRFAGLVGILSLILIAMGIIVAIFQALFIQSIFAATMLASGLSVSGIGSSVGGSLNILWVFLGISIVMGIIGLVDNIFTGLMFFDASRKFEA